LLKAWGTWLGETLWDYFLTITFRYDVKAKQTERMLLQLEAQLEKESKVGGLFWVVEDSPNGYQSHAHLLVLGEDMRSHIETFFVKHKQVATKKGIDSVVYDPIKGARYYICKDLGKREVKYGVYLPRKTTTASSTRPQVI
jgi:hypothetical protein